MNQDPQYITETLTFNELNFCQLVGGECRTMIKTNDPEELFGRLRILSKIAYLFNQCGSWERARATYFAIIGSIEEGEASWSSSFVHFDLMCSLNFGQQKQDMKNEPKVVTTRTQRNPTKRDFYCREFQKDECNLNAPHKAWIRSSFETVEHFCAPCYHAKLGKQMHVPGSDGCAKK